MINCEQYIEIILNHPPDRIREYNNLDDTSLLTFNSKFCIYYSNHEIWWENTETKWERNTQQYRIGVRLMEDSGVVAKLNELVKVWAL